jgi:dihydrofolate reductase
MKISLIVAMSKNRVIGQGDALPWRLPADLRRFKLLTMGHWLILGRKTFETIGKPLAGRHMIVVTHQEGFAPTGIQVAHSVEQALAMANGDEVFVAGGAQIYNQTLDRANRLYMTFVKGEFEGDAFFPVFDESDWQLVSEEGYDRDEKNLVPYCFRIYDRRHRG